MVGGNYPPGTSRRDLIRGGIIEPHHHECEFHPVEDPEYSPIIEDGAAIFHERCRYAEGEYGEKWQCEETRTYRFEYSELESPSGKTWDLPDITEWDDHDLPEKHAEKVVTMEERFHGVGPSDEVTLDVDPDRDAGIVTIEYCGWKLHFRP
jgi:hypothetical protein